jgi:hypothetical protein
MTNPYAAPGIEAEASGWKADQRYVLSSLGLGVAWWAALLVPTASREILLEGGRLNVAWGITRVVIIVAVACLLYGRLRRAWPFWSWLSALACAWIGCAVFALSMRPGDPFSLMMAVIGPPVFFVMAAYVVFPMTLVTALVLGRLQPRARKLR